MNVANKPVARPSSAAPLARRPRNREATIRAVLESAQRLFLTKGFDNTSLVDIAGETGLSPRGVILHFSSKADIAAELLFRDLRARAQSFPAVEDASNGRDAILAFFRWLAEGDRRLFINFAALWGFSARWSQQIESTLEKVMADLLAPARRAIERGVAAGEFRAIDPALACDMLWIAYLSGLRRAAIRGGSPTDALAQVERAVSLLSV